VVGLGRCVLSCAWSGLGARLGWFGCSVIGVCPGSGGAAAHGSARSDAARRDPGWPGPVGQARLARPGWPGPVGPVGLARSGWRGPAGRARLGAVRCVRMGGCGLVGAAQPALSGWPGPVGLALPGQVGPARLGLRCPVGPARLRLARPAARERGRAAAACGPRARFGSCSGGSVAAMCRDWWHVRGAGVVQCLRRSSCDCGGVSRAPLMQSRRAVRGWEGPGAARPARAAGGALGPRVWRGLDPSAGPAGRLGRSGRSGSARHTAVRHSAERAVPNA
jgi:hypothetical protein